MFAYCGNSPVINADPLGQRHMAHTIIGGDNISPKASSEIIRDVTSEIAIPLQQAIARANILDLFSELTNEIWGGMFIYPEFYRLVNHKAPWDIKREEVWEATIKTEYPGYNTVVSFCEIEMTPESIGNFTYGYLGQEYGIPSPLLIAGSYYAAGFPTARDDLLNEITDWGYIYLGFLYSKINYLGGY